MLIFSLHSASNRTANLSWLYLLFKVQRNVNKYSVKSGVQNKTISNRTDCLCAGLFYEFETVAPSENRTICINIHYLAGVCHRNGTAPSNRTIQVDSNRISHTHHHQVKQRTSDTRDGECEAQWLMLKLANCFYVNLSLLSFMIVCRCDSYRVFIHLFGATGTVFSDKRQRIMNGCNVYKQST